MSLLLKKINEEKLIKNILKYFSKNHVVHEGFSIYNIPHSLKYYYRTSSASTHISCI